MVPKNLNIYNEFDPQSFENDWGLFIDIENYQNENEIEKQINNSLKYQQVISEYFEYKRNKNNFGLFNCITTTLVTSCLTYIVLWVL
jgi:hypothetical protein